MFVRGYKRNVGGAREIFKKEKKKEVVLSKWAWPMMCLRVTSL
jgi:hypothetical protein